MFPYLMKLHGYTKRKCDNIVTQLQLIIIYRIVIYC